MCTKCAGADVNSITDKSKSNRTPLSYIRPSLIRNYILDSRVQDMATLECDDCEYDEYAPDAYDDDNEE